MKKYLLSFCIAGLLAAPCAHAGSAYYNCTVVQALPSLGIKAKEPARFAHTFPSLGDGAHQFSVYGSRFSGSSIGNSMKLQTPSALVDAFFTFDTDGWDTAETAKVKFFVKSTTGISPLVLALDCKINSRL